jgi:hypothetical protein
MKAIAIILFIVSTDKKFVLIIVAILRPHPVGGWEENYIEENGKV